MATAFTALGSFTGGDGGLGEMGYDTFRDSQWGQFLKPLDGTAFGDILKEYWTNILGTFASVGAAPGTFLKAMAFVAGGVGLYQSGISEDFRTAWDNSAGNNRKNQLTLTPEQMEALSKARQASQTERASLATNPSSAFKASATDPAQALADIAADPTKPAALGASEIAAEKVMADSAHIQGASKLGTAAILAKAEHAIDNISAANVAQVEGRYDTAFDNKNRPYEAIDPSLENLAELDLEKD